MSATDSQHAPSLAEIVREWGRIGCTGFGGPAVHIALLRELCVAERKWIDEKQFERVLAATNMLPGPASTQLAIYCAWRLRGRLGALLGGLCFVMPGLILVIGLSTLFLAKSPPLWVRGAGLGDHRVFHREGDDIHLTVPVSITEAALGAKVEVPTIDGRALLKIPPGTQCGQKLRLREKGVPSATKEGKRGDEIVEIKVAVPHVQDERSKEILREMAKLNSEDPRHELWQQVG